jgi:2-C-methyl-D-erythritol 4-phosphate cytidylyltransferase
MFWKKKPVQTKPARPWCTAVVPAAGSSQRMNGADKLFYEINGRPLLAYTLEALQQSEWIREIVIAAAPGRIIDVYDICKTYQISKAAKVVCGGKNRCESVLFALREASKKTKLIAVHDGARPLVCPQDIDAVTEKAAQFAAAVLAVPLKDTIKETKNGVITRTPNRGHWRIAQTPQVFDIDLLQSALLNVCQKGIAVTDDSMAVEMLGVPVHIIEGSYDNIKVTTQDDIAAVHAVLEMKYNEDRTRV